MCVLQVITKIDVSMCDKLGADGNDALITSTAFSESMKEVVFMVIPRLSVDTRRLAVLTPSQCSACAAAVTLASSHSTRHVAHRTASWVTLALR